MNRTWPLWLTIIALYACGQEPSFVDQTESQRSQSIDATAPGGSATGEPGLPGSDSGEGDIDGDGASDSNDGQDGGGDSGDSNDDGKPNTEKPGTGNGDSDADAGDGMDGTAGDGNDPNDPNNPGNPNNPDNPNNEIPKITREQTYDGDRQGDGAVLVGLDTPYIDQQFTLTRNNTERTKFYVQKTRPNVVDKFEQGNAPTPATEFFKQVADRPLDIVVVVDNSGSMVEEQNKLAPQLSPLLSHIATANWQIGVVSTDSNRSCLEALIKKDDADTAGKFSRAVSLGDRGSGSERGVLMAVRALKGACLTTPWVRSNSVVAVLIVSDEDNCSNGTDCGNVDYASGAYLKNYLASIRTPGVNARVYGIYWKPTDSSAQCPTGYNKANIYASLVADTNGHAGSICDSSYNDTLQKISENIQDVLSNKFTLAQTPDAGTISVFVNDVLQAGNYTITGKVVEFTTPPPADADVRIVYGHGAREVKKTFNLSKKVYGDGIAVKVAGAIVDPSEYTYDSATNRITFATAPADRTMIEVGYVEDIALTKDFLLFDDLKASTLLVDIDGVATTDFTYVQVFRMVTFAVPPPAGSRINFYYTIEGPAVLGYPMAISNGPPVDLHAFDASTGNPVNVSWANQTLTVNGADFVEGRVIIVRRDNTLRQVFSVDLGAAPVPGSVVAEGGGLICKDPKAIVIQGMRVNVTGCGFPDATTDVTVRFHYVLEQFTTFTFNLPDLPAADAFQEWKVFINDKRTTAFTRVGNVITLDSQTAPGAKVRVSLTQYQ